MIELNPGVADDPTFSESIPVTIPRSWIIRVAATALSAAFLPAWSSAQDPVPSQDPQAPPAAEAPPAPPGGEQPKAAPLPGPPPIPKAELGPVLKTVPVRRGEISPNVQMVDASVLPRDREGIWVLDFSFKPMRLATIDIPGKGRRRVHYLYYRVVNRTGEPRMFVPQFTLVTDTGKRYDDSVLPQAVSIIAAREDAAIPLLGAVDVVGYLPPTGKQQGIDDAVFGVAVWEGVDPAADRFSVFVRGLSDGYQEVTPPNGGETITRYKTLRIDFLRPGDERNPTEREIRLAEPAYEWIYW